MIAFSNIKVFILAITTTSRFNLLWNSMYQRKFYLKIKLFDGSIQLPTDNILFHLTFDNYIWIFFHWKNMASLGQLEMERREAWEKRNRNVIHILPTSSHLFEIKSFNGIIVIDRERKRASERNGNEAIEKIEK